MDSIEIKAPAKINLSLDVLKKRPDGYHEVRMIMQEIELHDTLFLEARGDGIEVLCDCPWVSSGESNIAYKVAALLKKKHRIDNGIRIKIHKNIPVAAGLGGGSSDAASVLKGMNELFGLGLCPEELMTLGKDIGADVPFFIKGGTALAEGIGEKLTGLRGFSDVDILLVTPRLGVSTAWVYKNLVLEDVKERPDTNLLVDAINACRVDVLARNMRNVLENVTLPRYRVVKQIKDKLVQLGALGSLMSGSGPSVFGIFGNRDLACRAYEKMAKGRWKCFLTHTI